MIIISQQLLIHKQFCLYPMQVMLKFIIRESFTVFDSKGGGYCYVWDETCGLKVSSEIGTCLLYYIKDLPQNVTHDTTYSNTCGGQNRNQFIAAALLYAVNKSQVQTIDIKFMESGHSYLETDSMHATIERA